MKTLALLVLFGLVCAQDMADDNIHGEITLDDGGSTSEIFGDSAENGSTCGGNCPSGSCTTCRCGTSKAPANIANECSKYSGWSQSCC